MAITYVGGTSGVGTGASYTVSLNGTLTGGSGTSPIAGDLVVVISGFGNTANTVTAITITGNNNGAYTLGTGWYSNDTWDANGNCAYKRQGSTVDTQITVARTNNTTYGGATVVQVWRGVDATTPLDTTTIGVSASNQSSCVINPGSISPTTSGAIVLAGGVGTMAATSSAYTSFSGMSNFVTNKGDGSTSDTAAAIASYAWTSGAYDPPTIAGGTTATSSSWIAITMALRPVLPASLNGESGSSAVTGSSAIVSRTGFVVGSSGAFTLEGLPSVLLLDRYITATASSVSITGQPADLSTTAVGVTHYSLVLSSSSYTITGFETCLAGDNILMDGDGNPILDGDGDWILSEGCGRIVLPTQLLAVSITGRDSAYERTKGLNAGSGSIIIVGVVAELISITHYNLSCDPGSVAITGNLSSVSASRSIIASAGSIVITSQYSVLTSTRTIAALSSSLTISGAISTLVGSRNLNLEPSSYVIAGSTTSKYSVRVLALGLGTYQLTGLDYTGLITRELNSSSGTITIVGEVSSGLSDKAVAVDPGSILLTGQFSTVFCDRVLTLSSGEIFLCGLAAELTKSTEGQSLNAEYATFTITPVAAFDNIYRDNDGEPILDSDGNLIFTDPTVTTDYGSYTIIGWAASLDAVTGEEILGAGLGTVSITGGSSEVLRTYYLNSESGSYTVTGYLSGVLHDGVLSIVAGEVLLTGSSSYLVAERNLYVEPSSITISGNSADLSKQSGRLLAADAGEILLLGSHCACTIVRKVSLDPGSISITGEQAPHDLNKQLITGSGQISLTGSDAKTIVAHILSAVYAVVNISGQTASLTNDSGFKLAGDSGSYAVTGNNILSGTVRELLANSGIYTIGGLGASLFSPYSVYIPSKEFTRYFTNREFLDRYIPRNYDHRDVERNYILGERKTTLESPLMPVMFEED